MANDLLLAVSRRLQDRMLLTARMRGLMMAGELRPGDPGLSLNAQAGVRRLAGASSIGVSLFGGHMLNPVKSVSMMLVQASICRRRVGRAATNAARARPARSSRRVRGCLSPAPCARILRPSGRKAPAPATEHHTLKFPQLDREIVAEPGETTFQSARRNGLCIVGAGGGRGACTVQIMDGEELHIDGRAPAPRKSEASSVSSSANYGAAPPSNR